MSSKNNFYITLSSVASSSYFKNSPANFKVNLANPLELGGQWEVALSEITYQKKWKNIPEEITLMAVHDIDKVEDSNKLATATTSQASTSTATTSTTTVTTSTSTTSTPTDTTPSSEFEQISESDIIRQRHGPKLLRRVFKIDGKDRVLLTPLPPSPTENKTIINVAVNVKPPQAESKLPTIPISGKATTLTVNSKQDLNTTIQDVSMRKLQGKIFNLISSYPETYPDATTETYQWTTTIFKIPAGDYIHISQLIDLLQRQLPDDDVVRRGPDQGINIDYNPISGSISIKGADFWISTNDRFMKESLGFDDAICDAYEGMQYCIYTIAPFKFPAKLPFPLKTIFVYCDVVEHNLVGDANVPLLRTINVPTDQERNVNIIFNRPYYRPVSKGYINSIEVQLSDKSGDVIPFVEKAGCETLCVLHFRKCPLEI
jgi:hypothetical protein